MSTMLIAITAPFALILAWLLLRRPIIYCVGFVAGVIFEIKRMHRLLGFDVQPKPDILNVHEFGDPNVQRRPDPRKWTPAGGAARKRSYPDPARHPDRD